MKMSQASSPQRQSWHILPLEKEVKKGWMDDVCDSLSSGIDFECSTQKGESKSLSHHVKSESPAYRIRDTIFSMFFSSLPYRSVQTYDYYRGKFDLPDPCLID